MESTKASRKPIYKKWWFWVIIAAIVIGVIVAATSGGDEDNTANNNDSNSSQSTTDNSAAKDVSPTWTKVATLSGKDEESVSKAFKLSGGKVRISYDIRTSTKGEAIDSGTALIYVLEEGRTKSTDKNGKLDVAIQDVTTVGTDKGSEVVKKKAGNYFIDINTSGVSSYTVTIEEEKE